MITKTPRKGEVIVTCIEHGSNSMARSKLTMRFGGRAVESTQRATASCTMGTAWAVKACALKLLLGTARTLTLECIEDNKTLPRRTKWRVSR